jgi:hypothetical protein
VIEDEEQEEKQDPKWRVSRELIQGNLD